MPQLDLLVYRDMDDTLHTGFPATGQDAGEWFGEMFGGLYVTAVGPGIHKDRKTVVLSHEPRPEMQQEIKQFFGDGDPDHEWLRTQQGRAWLETEEGTRWVTSVPGGIRWSESSEGREWFEELAQRGFDRYFSGEMPILPEWAISPDEAPRIGDRVRLARSETTMGGAAFEEGDLAIVSELRLAPVGCVFVLLRAVDGRTLLTGHRAAFNAATS